ncbi:MAG TPA: YjgN family protein [Rhizobiaceae bacterium]|nr:YjgN family protein [Rhizobiaceae bacterium]
MDQDIATGSAPTPAPVSLKREPFTFTGTTREYFGIWIVNVLLTILTLGIYSAWAKVRRQRYFYGNTWLAGANFEYHARPVQILIGRLIVVTLLVAYQATAYFAPLVSGIIGVAFIFLLPFFVSRGMRFNARVTSYRNVRFDFTGKYGGAFLAYLLGGALVYGTGGILAPLASQWMWNYSLGNLKYGNRPIKCDPRLEKLYGIWWLPAGILVLGWIVIVAVLIGLAVTFSDRLGELLAIVGESLQESRTEGSEGDVNTPSPMTVLIIVYSILIPFFILYAIAALIYRAGTRNVALNETIIDGRHIMSSEIHRGRFAWISISNLVATIATLGLLRPWAAIRMAKYMASVTALDATSSLEEYFGSIQDSGAAVGAEYLDVEGFDLGF